MRRLIAAIATVAVPMAALAQGTVDFAKAKLRNPATFTERAPHTFKAKFETSKGSFVVTVHRAWAPLGADRFYNLVKGGFYDECRFFRVIDGFIAQVGINGNPDIQSAWRDATIPDDPVKESNKRGTVTFAKTRAASSRSTQFFINLVDSSALDKQGSAPFGEVSTGMEIVETLYSGYGEGAPSGKGPEQAKVQSQGNAYLTKEFPKLDYIKRATIEK
jgi:peptidyl-prolyl cis-trans isomerase A (cyclophilin A)